MNNHISSSNNFKLAHSAIGSNVIYMVGDKNRILPESNTLLETLKQKKVRFAHWKGNSHLLESLAGTTDVELLIYPADRQVFESIMVELAYKKLNCQSWNKVTGIEDWLGFDNSSGKLLHLHTHFDLITGITIKKHLYLPWLEEFFETLVIDEQTGWPIPSPEMESLILLLRIQSKLRIKENTFLDSKRAELLYLLSKSKQENFIKLCHKLDLKLPSDINQRLTDISVKSTDTDIVRLSQILFHQLKTTSRLTSTVTTIQSSIIKFYLKLKKKTSIITGPVRFKKTLSGSSGKIIAVVGSDGSGKSTLCKEIIKWLSFKLDAHYCYLGKNPFFKSNNIKQFSLINFFFLNNKFSKTLRRLLGRLYPIIIMRRKVSMLRQAKLLANKGSVIICDRLPQNDINGFNDGPSLQEDNKGRFSDLEMKLYNQINEMGTNLVLKLIVSPEVAYSRKPEHNTDIIMMKCKNQHKIKYKHSTVIEIDANQPFEQVLLSAKREIWQIL